MNSGHRPEALKLVTVGLEHSPNAKVLLQLYRDLGGKPSGIPKPIEKPEVATPTAAEDAAAMSNSPPPTDAKGAEK